MSAVTVTIRLSEESAAFMFKCVADAGAPELHAFFEAAVAALAEKLLDLDVVNPDNGEIAERGH